MAFAFLTVTFQTHPGEKHVISFLFISPFRKSKHLPNELGQSKHLPNELGQSKHLPNELGQSKHLPNELGQSKQFAVEQFAE